LEAKARKILANEKKKEFELERVIPTFEGAEFEKKLRKVATRGG